MYPSLISYTDTQTDVHTSLNIMVAPDTPYHSTKFQPYTPSQSKVIPTHVNSTYTPLLALNHTCGNFCIGYHKYTPIIYAYKTLPKNIDY